MVSLSLPHCLEVSALMMFSDLFAFSFIVFVCSVNVSLGSKVSPNTLGNLFVGMSWPLIVRLYSAGSGVKCVALDLED